MTQEPSSDPKTAVFEATLKLIDEADSYQAVDHLEQAADIQVVADRYREIVRWLYGKKRVAEMTLLGRAGIRYCLAEARRTESSDVNRSGELKGIAKTIAYNVSANLWPGWNEEGIVLSASDLAAGLDLARLNLRLGLELKKGPEALGNAWWLLGAHELAQGRSERARSHFKEATQQFTLAGKADFVLMSEGYAAVAECQAREQDGAARLQTMLQQLRALGTDDGRFFAEQIEIAHRVLVK